MAAGLGKRLRPLTEVRPKPLVPIFGRPLIAFVLDHLMAHGVREFVVNTHQLAGQFEAFFRGGCYRGCRVDLIHEPDLLETGGGIKNAERLIGRRPFLVASGDILTDIDLDGLIQEHFRAGNHVTLALRETGFPPSIELVGTRIVGIGRGPGSAPTHDFANISLWDPSGFDRIPPCTKVSFVPVLSDWISEGGKIGGVVLNQNHWFNVGTPEEYRLVHQKMWTERWASWQADVGWPAAVSPEARVPDSASLHGFTVLGAGCSVGEEAVLEDCILWPGAKTASRIRLERCIVRQFAGESATDTIL